MKLNDFIKKDSNTKASNYKVVVGNSPKEQELAKEASKVTILEGKNSELSIKLSKYEEDNNFLKEQIKTLQLEKNELKNKVKAEEDIKMKLYEKENRLTDVLDEIHELQIKEKKKKNEVKELNDNLRETTGELTSLKRTHDGVKEQLDSTTAKLYGANSELNRIKDFSEKTQDEYNKLRDRNTVLLSERENISKLKAEFEAKSIRLGEELNKATSVIKDLKSKLEHTTKLNSNSDKQLVKSSNLNVKLSKDLDKAVKVSDNLESSLNKAREDVQNMSQITQLYKQELARKKQESTEWNIAKQQLKLGNAYTYPNKLGFGASPFFKLDEGK